MTHPFAHRVVRGLVLLALLLATWRDARAAKCPNLQIVLDRSGSMSTALGNGTRWTVARDAINQVLARYDGRLPIGLSIFPLASCDAETPVVPAYNTKAAVAAAINKSGPSGSTPTVAGLQAAANLSQLKDPSRKQFVILLTDGGPNCNSTCPSTVMQLDSMLKASPSITTFVVGFGGGLAASEKDCLTQLGAAGGHPAATPEKFYVADNADQLNKALEEILNVVTGEFGNGACDDTCYSNGCPTGQVCSAAECRADPCLNVRCGAGSYCFTDGVSPGQCVSVCNKTCPSGMRCQKGVCKTDACGIACPAGTLCGASGSCVPDGQCQNLPPEKQCRGTSRCSQGKCVDDPCNYIKCPSGLRCVAWEGTCEAPPAVPPDMSNGGGGIDEGGEVRRGCNAMPGSTAAALPGIFWVLSLIGLLALRRRLRQGR